MSPGWPIYRQRLEKRNWTTGDSLKWVLSLSTRSRSDESRAKVRTGRSETSARRWNKSSLLDRVETWSSTRLRDRLLACKPLSVFHLHLILSHRWTKTRMTTRSSSKVSLLWDVQIRIAALSCTRLPKATRSVSWTRRSQVLIIHAILISLRLISATFLTLKVIWSHRSEMARQTIRWCWFLRMSWSKCTVKASWCWNSSRTKSHNQQARRQKTMT